MQASSMSEDNDWDKVNVDDAVLSDGTSTPQQRENDEAPSNPTASTENVTSTAAATSTTDEVTPSSEDSVQPQPLQIVSIGTETDKYAFTYHEDALNSILDKVPSDTKVSIVSVVGAFRTGKSFLLSWFLRYLHHLGKSLSPKSSSSGPIDEIKEKKLWYEEFECLGNSDGFHWRGGAERNTTGIWIWSEPFFLPKSPENEDSDEKVAVLLVDTQGMFDHETTMALTASIFGLSTLLSSYQIYNVDKRIQEDNLEQLALFSEYGRLAMQNHNKDNEEEQVNKPFQLIEFLVRDWQNFEDDEDIDACEGEMDTYLDQVLAERDASDLKQTRQQIFSCFDKIRCYLMTHPGFSVTKKKYDGKVTDVHPIFIQFLDRYCQRVFSELETKSINGRELTAPELAVYIKAYASMFETGAEFPKAVTLLEATATANNTNATNKSIQAYKERMDKISGPKCSHYLSPSELEQSHRDLFSECNAMFDDMANFGNKDSIEEAKDTMLKSIDEAFEVYSKLNEGRNPIAGYEIYIIPLCVGFFSIVFRWIADWTCSEWSQTCKASSDVLSHIYQVVIFFILINGATKAKQISELITRLKTALSALSGSNEIVSDKKTN